MRLMRKFCVSPSLERHQICDQIFTHLTHLFSSTAYFSSFNGEFGLINYTGELLSEPLVERIKEDIRRIVLSWETRFSLDEVEFMTQRSQSLSQPLFRLHGWVDGEACLFDFPLHHRH